MSFVIDSSAALAWLLEDEKSAASESLLSRLVNGADKALAPPLLYYEVSNALAMAVKRGRLDRNVKRGLLGYFRLLPIHLDEDSDHLALTSTQTVAEKHGLTIYDASYLELALRHGLPLATNDAALLRAARTEGVVLEKTA